MIKVSNRPLSASGGDTLIYLVRQGKKKAPLCSDRQISAYIRQAYALGDFKGKSGQRLIFYRPVKKDGKAVVKPMRVMVIGLGKEDPDLELFRKVGGVIAGTALKLKAGRMRIEMVEGLDIDAEEIARGLSEGLIMGSYQFDKYKKEDPEDKKYRLKEVVIHTAAVTPVKKGLKMGMAAALAVNIARDMANEPGNYWTATHFANTGKELAKEKGLTCKVLEKAAMQKLGMGGIIGVNQGSEQPPKMVILEYRSRAKKAPTLLLVGKGLTFDSGGISLKPGAGMQDMKYDMCGGAAVMAAMRAVGELKPAGINVVAIIPSTDNMPGPGALKPGDIISQYNGKTVEVINTDAEGRLILADALAYGIDKFKPDAVVDIATLTGAVIIGLGHHQTGMLSNDDDLAAKLLDSGKQSGEPNWRLPLGKDYQKQLKSEVADLKNIGGRDAGTITGACFLQEFVGETPWAHLDIAGTAWNYTKKSYIPKGPSGVGVRTLIELVLNWK